MSPSSYCWWKKSCTTWDVQNPKNNDRFSISTGAGFLPSTVSKSTRTGRWLMPSPQPSEGHHQVWRRRERHAQWSPTGLLHWWRSQGKRWCSPTCWLLETSPKSSCTFPSDSSSWCCGCYQYQRTSSMHPPASPYVRWHLHRCLAPLSNIKTSEEGTAVSTPISTSSIRPSSGCCGSNCGRWKGVLLPYILPKSRLMDAQFALMYWTSCGFVQVRLMPCIRWKLPEAISNRFLRGSDSRSLISGGLLSRSVWGVLEFNISTLSFGKNLRNPTSPIFTNTPLKVAITYIYIYTYHTSTFKEGCRP